MPATHATIEVRRFLYDAGHTRRSISPPKNLIFDKTNISALTDAQSLGLKPANKTLTLRRFRVIWFQPKHESRATMRAAVFFACLPLLN